MNNTLVIGDIHGKLDKYANIVRFADFYGYNTLTVGDNGFQKEWEWGLKNLNVEKHRWLMGNHDFYPYLNCSLSLGNYGIIYDKYFFVRGAKSIDRSHRLEGYDWFSNEELSYKEMLDCLTLYEESKPKIVITHECPDIVCEELFGINEHSSTRKFLNELFDIHQPDFWFFGHFHKSRKKNIKGCQFQCLAELEYVQLP